MEVFGTHQGPHRAAMRAIFACILVTMSHAFQMPYSIQKLPTSSVWQQATSVFFLKSKLLATTLFSSPDDEADAAEYMDTVSSPAPAAAPAPPPVPPKPLDPLMASLTKTDPSVANLPTRKVPIFGEVPVDGSLVVLVPAATIAVLGLLLSVVVAVNSKDLIVSTLSQVSDEITQTAVRQSNQMYDNGVCRGICSSHQQDDLEGLQKFMDTFKKK